jgi:hypothetical protein
MTQGIKSNLITYGIFLSIAAAGLVYGKSILSSFNHLRVWDVQTLLLLLIGVPFLFFQTKAGFPDFWDRRVSHRTRMLWPILIGMVFGIMDVLVFKVLLHPEPYTELPPFLQPFPYSLLLYFSGALEVEVFYRLIPLTLICAIGHAYKKGQYANLFFWTAAILTSVREPLEQYSGGSALLIFYSFATGFSMNFIQAAWYKKAGFPASLFIRLGHYLIWHIVLGIYVESVEL